MNDDRISLPVLLTGLLLAAFAGVAVAVIPLFNLNAPPPPPLTPITTLPAPTETPANLTPGQEFLDGVGTAGGEVWAEVTGPEAKQWYSDTWDDVKSGAGRVADSFSETVETQRQNQQPAP